MRLDKINKEQFLKRYNEALSHGLSKGVGERGSQMCIEAAICFALDEPHGDKPSCVGHAVRQFKIILNDYERWQSPQSRAEVLRDLGIAQLGSDELDQKEFARKLVEKHIRVLIPTLFREVFPSNKECLEAADLCEQEGTLEAALKARAADAAAHAGTWAHDAARAAADAAWAAAHAGTWAHDAARAAADAAWAAAHAAAARAAADAAAAWAAAHAAAHAARASKNPEKYLRLSAQLALEVLKEMKSPGCEWLE